MKRGSEGEEREATEKREEDNEVGSGLVNDPAWRTPPEVGAGGRNWGRTREGGMCSWGRPAKVSTVCSKTSFRFEHPAIPSSCSQSRRGPGLFGV